MYDKQNILIRCCAKCFKPIKEKPKEECTCGGSAPQAPHMKNCPLYEKPDNQIREKKIDELVNTFIKRWLPDYSAHLLDTDDNEGEELRNNLKALLERK